MIKLQSASNYFSVAIVMISSTSKIIFKYITLCIVRRRTNVVKKYWYCMLVQSVTKRMVTASTLWSCPRATTYTGRKKMRRKVVLVIRPESEMNQQADTDASESQWVPGSSADPESNSDNESGTHISGSRLKTR
jgi:hypothetical protein